MIGGPGRVGRVGGGVFRAAPPPVFDFTISNTTVTTQWGPAVVVGTFTPVGTADEVYFELVSEDAGFAVENG
jgi:hypothetical protein